MSIIPTERVLVVPTPVFHRLGHFQGFSNEPHRYLGELLQPPHVSYRPRSDMEEDPEFKQLIPYVIFRYTDPQGRAMLFHYRRGKGQGEQRLHSKRSIGVGGHISSDDANGADGRRSYEEGKQRELDEEVIVRSPGTDQCVGLINDDTTPVGQVHLGVVHLVDVERPEVEARECEILESGFTPVEQLIAEDLDAFETWSQICLRELFGARPLP